MRGPWWRSRFRGRGCWRSEGGENATHVPSKAASRASSRVALFLHLKLHLGDAAVDHAELFGGGMRDIDHAPGDERAAVVDPDGDGLPGGDIGNAQARPERQCAVRGGQLAGVELLPARGLY